MKKYLLILVVIVLSSASPALSQDKLQITPFLHQTGMYYSSDKITCDGFGLGMGIHLLHRTQIAGQADVNLLWGNGNAITTRLALGYEKKGTWTPGIYATLNLAWGQKVQLLSESGEKASLPVCIGGLRIVPLKFRTKYGYVSALEIGYGMGSEKGRSIEFSILAVGLKL